LAIDWLLDFLGGFCCRVGCLTDLRQSTHWTHSGYTPHADQQIINPDLGRSSTGSLAIHAAMVPTTTKVLLWGRQQPTYEPGMFTGALCVTVFGSCWAGCGCDWEQQCSAFI